MNKENIMENDRIEELLEEIEEAKRVQAEAKGTMKHIEKQLETEFGCDIKSVKNEIKKLDKEIKETEETIDEKREELKEKHGIE